MDAWRLLVSPSAAGACNMALDHAVAEHVQSGAMPPTLRFYSWRPRALSLGRSQPVAAVNRKLASQRGIDVVRRPTGGQAILHSDELTYAIALPSGHRLSAGGILQSYRALSAGLTAGLRLLQLTPETGEWSPRDAAAQDALCFGSASTHEIAVGGHKVIGSAQHRLRRGLLQHGSIVLSHDPDIYPLMGVTRTGCMPLGLRAMLAEAMTLGSLIERFAQGFAEGLGATLDPRGLSASERARANELVRLRYGTDGWLTRH